MKNLLLTCFLLLGYFSANCQTAKTDEAKLYGSLNLGLYIGGEDWYATVHGATGCQIRNWLGLGVNLGRYSQISIIPSGFNGMGLEYRLRLPKKWEWTLSNGIGYGSYKQNDSPGKYRPAEKRFPFFKGSLAYKIGKMVTLGACIWYAEPKMEIWREEYDANQNPYLTYARTSKEVMAGWAFTLGLNIN